MHENEAFFGNWTATAWLCYRAVTDVPSLHGPFAVSVLRVSVPAVRPCRSSFANARSGDFFRKLCAVTGFYRLPGADAPACLRPWRRALIRLGRWMSKFFAILGGAHRRFHFHNSTPGERRQVAGG